MTHLGETLRQHVIHNRVGLLRDALLENNVDSSIVDSSLGIPVDSTLLIIAIKYNREDVVKLLIDEEECEIDAQDGYDQTALMYASSMGYLHLVKRLIEANSNINHQNCKQRTALHFAAIQGHANVVRALLTAKGINPDEVNQNDESRAEMNCLDNEGRSLLMCAGRSERCTPEIIHLLVSGGCDVNQKSTYGNPTIHQVLDFNPNKQIVQALIDCGANISATDRNGDTPLQKAVRKNPNINVIRMLVEASDVNHRSNGDETILMHALYAAENTDVEIIRYLLESGADINAVEERDYTILMSAVMRYPDTNNFVNIDTVRFLLDAGCADTINKRDNDGFTALHWAVLDGNVNAVPVLLGVNGIEVSMLECLQAANSDVADQINPDGLDQSECLREVALYLKRVHAATVIQRHWRECYSNPSYLVCRKRLIKVEEDAEEKHTVKRSRRRR